MKEGRKGARPEPSLYRRAAGGAREALEQLVEYHRSWVERLVHSLISRLPRLGCCEKSDIINEAEEALVRALRRYDADRGVPFEAYAQLAIRGAIIKSLAQCFELSEAARRAFPHVFNALEELMQKGVSNPTPPQIQEALKKKGLSIPLHVIMELLSRTRLVSFAQGEEDLDSNVVGVEEERWDPQKLQGSSDAERSMEGWDCIKAELGQEEGWKFAVLAILHDGLGYKWSEIACLLESGGSSDWAEQWAIHIRTDWPHALWSFPDLDNWEAVRCRFKDPSPRLTAANLRQWYSRHRRQLRHTA